eukprot:Opistho-2@29514
MPPKSGPGDEQALINYYAREGYYRHIQVVCQDSIKKYGNDPIMSFWKAFGGIMGGWVAEGMREVQGILDKRDVSVAAILLLIDAHKQSKLVDQEAVHELEARLTKEEDSAGEVAIEQAALYLWHAGRFDEARKKGDKFLQMCRDGADRSAERSVMYVRALTLRGWIDLTCGRESTAKKADKAFLNEALKSMGDNKNYEALLAMARHLSVNRRRSSDALECINMIIASNQTFLPALVEKMRVLLSMDDWDQALEVTQRIMEINPQDVEAARMVLLHRLARIGGYPQAAKRLGELIQTLDRFEPKNHRVYFECARSLCRLAGRNPLVLQQTLELVERARTLMPLSAEYTTEAGYQQLLRGDVPAALASYKAAMKLDESSVSALNGIIRCQLIDGQIEDAEQQLEFLREIQTSIGKSAELCQLSSYLAWKKNRDSQTALANLGEAIDVQVVSVKDTPISHEYFVRLNPTFLLQIVDEYLQFVPAEPKNEAEPASPVLAKCTEVLEMLAKICPGMLSVMYQLARVRYLNGDIDGAQAALQRVLKQDSTYSEGHLLMAQIYLTQSNYKMAGQSLEVGLSYNFEVREFPLYHLIKARIQKRTGLLAESMQTLNAAMALPGVRRATEEEGTSGKRSKKQSKAPVRDIPNSDRVSVFLELADSLRRLDQQHEATKVMQDAINEFSRTAEEARVQIANAELSLARGDVDVALATLGGIGPDQPYFANAKAKMADIFLHQRRDLKMYAACYKELVDRNPSTHSCMMLGDAYMSITEIDRAIHVYEEALKKNPHDSILATKIGKALVRTHNYSKAINYYVAAVKNGGQAFLQYDLAELYLKLGHADKAERVLLEALNPDSQPPSEPAAMIQDAKMWVLLARVYKEGGAPQRIADTLVRARELQTRVLVRIAREQPDQLRTQKLQTSTICFQLADHFMSQREYEKASGFYKEALTYDETSEKAMLALAKLYLSQGELDLCQQQCVSLLRMNHSNDAATIMMADLMFRKGEYESATFHFQQLLERKPNHYEGLSRVIDLLYRAGKLPDCQKFIGQATKASPRAASEPGLNYCQGLYNRYSNNPNEALKHFNRARKDQEWGELAIYNMIEVCLNPDNETIGGETFESVTDNSQSGSSEKPEAELFAVKTAEKLLKEVKNRPKSFRHQILECNALMATKLKTNIEKALTQYMELLNTERDSVAALLGMATAYMLLKQTPRARNQLKRIAKMNWNASEADDFERAWLLLSDIYVQGGKYDMAQELLKRCLQHNKSCTKAWEYMGYIMEKEQSYRDASDHYENAWKFSSESNPAVGFKLAFNYLKAKRYLEAIDVSRKVLTLYPNYPKIRKEILEKASGSIRP